jgi:acyl dehydratase
MSADRAPPALVGHRTVTPDAVATFGGLTGDYSRIHFDHALGEASPYGRGFAPGLLGASWALGAMTLYAPERLGCGEPGAYLAGFQVRFHDVVRFGDTLGFGCSNSQPEQRVHGCEERCSEFAVLDQDGRTTTTGAVEVRVRDPRAPGWPAKEAASHEAHVMNLPSPPDVWAAEDVVAHGPRGVSPVRTLTETDVVNYVNFTGELNPAYVNAPFAQEALFGERLVPHMLCFCLGFSVWLRQLLALPLGGDESTAGHLGDRWRFVAPIHFGDTLQVRYQPLSLRRTRSQPTRGVATFGLQLVNQHAAVVQQGEVDMMLAMRDAAPV